MEELKQGKLVRSLGLFSVFILVVSSVIGSGIYKKVAPMSAELQSPSWVLPGRSRYLVRGVEQCGSGGFACRLGRRICLLPEDLQ